MCLSASYLFIFFFHIENCKHNKQHAHRYASSSRDVRTWGWTKQEHEWIKCNVCFLCEQNEKKCAPVNHLWREKTERERESRKKRMWTPRMVYKWYTIFVHFTEWIDHFYYSNGRHISASFFSSLSIFFGVCMWWQFVTCAWVCGLPLFFASLSIVSYC